MKTILLAALCVIGLSVANIYAQEAASDPAAKKILKKIKDKSKQYESLSATYTLTIENGEDKEVQLGKLAQKGEKYRINNNGNELICDGKTVWIYLQTQNEAQINDYNPEDVETISPHQILKIYENEDDYFYAVTDEDSRSYKIEFKPRDRNSDYFKIQAKIDKAKLEIVSVKIFGKDGTHYTLEIEKLTPASYEDGYFRFNKADHPGVEIVDMRID